MAQKRKFIHKEFIYFIVSAVFFAAVIATAAIFFATGISNQFPFLVYIYVLLLPISGALSLLTLQLFISRNKMLNTLRVENEYQLGVDSYFYNYTIFAERVAFLRKRNHRDKEYVIAFSAVDMNNITQLNRSTRELNGRISTFIRDELSVNEIFKKSHYAYCYYRNVFIIYSFENLEETNHLIEYVRDNIYRIVKENELKIFVQPHFGVAEVTSETSIIVAVDKAITARNLDEKTFEEVTFFKDSFQKEATKSEVDELQEALDNNEFVVYYQPKFNLKKKKFVGSEALVRWNSSKYGLLSPAKFIEKIESGGLIHDLDVFVLKQVIKDLESIKRSAKKPLPVSVNFSLYEFYSSTFLQELTHLVDSSSIPPELIQIEITETTTQANTFMATSILNRLRDRGYKIFMDDFGSGFSNIIQLNTLPFDSIKIDKKLIDGIVSDNKNRDIVKFLIALCKTNNLEIVAEGVDSLEKVKILEKIGCDVIQGYYYAEPMPLDDYLKFLEDNPFEKKGDSSQ